VHRLSLLYECLSLWRAAFDFDKGLIEGAFIDKCTMCPQRIDIGLDPACVATCPTDALVFGERADLLKEAHTRIQAHPARYIDRVYGETENGGTSYLILSHVPFEELGLPDVGDKPVREVSERAIGLTIPVAFGWGAALTAAAVGVNFLNRRSELMAGRAGRLKLPRRRKNENAPLHQPPPSYPPEPVRLGTADLNRCRFYYCHSPLC